jgi:signal transduction histidine kinase/putative methionine-R-sulfoxide reductase with GAF domain
MVTVNLKSILKKEAASVITNIINALGEPIGIEDGEGKLLLGESDKKSVTKIPVKSGDEIIGYVTGGEQAGMVAGLLEHLVGKEADKKTLGNEVLSLYREINLIYNFSEKLAVSLEIAQVGEMALAEATQLIQAGWGRVFLLNDKNVLEPVASFGKGVEVKKGIKAGEGIIGNIVDTGNAEIINDVQSDSRLSEKEKAMSSLICSPLKVKKEVKGVIVLGSEAALVYTAAELRLLTTVASQAALAIENAILHEKMVQEATRKIEARSQELESLVEKRTLEIRQQANELETLDNIVQVINREVELKNVLNALLEQGLKLFPQAEKGAILIRDLDSNKFKYQAAAGYDINLFKDIVLKEEEVIERFSEGTNQLEEGVYIVRNLDDRPVADKFKDIPAPKSILAMTVWLQDQLGGVMFFDNLSAINAFDKSDVQKLKRFREHAVSAISKAKTLQELQNNSRELEEQKKNIELLSEIGKEITASLSLEGVIDIVYEHVNTLMDAAVFGIGIYNRGKDRIDVPANKEKGKTLPLHYYELKDENRPAVWCYKNQKEIFINDLETEYTKYTKKLPSATIGDNPKSIMYLPVTYQSRKIGVITSQSFEKNAYTEFHLNVLRNLATYAAIALDNADAYRKLNSTLDDLKATQQQLIVQEKLASLGQLTAGIAHEIKNPLNFVNNFAELSVELVIELREEIEKQKDKVAESEYEDLLDILENLESNAKRINEHGKRADSIVHNMLQHSRGQAGEREETDINAMLAEDLNLAYHGMRARDSSFNVTMETNFDKNIGKLTVVPQNISRAFLNIITNGFYELNRKKQENGDSYEPVICVSSANKDEHVEIRIRDNGDGIPESIRDKLFNPFFTTKPTGQGTGLGLSLSFDIIAKEHQGDITFESKEGEYTEFIITLPKNGK